jgi:Neprosin
MSSNMHVCRGRSWLTGAVTTCAATLAAVGLAVLAPSPVAASASMPASVSAASAPVGSKVACTKRPAVQPPPLGVLKAIPADGYVGRPKPVPAPAPKPVCPLGEVPVVGNLYRGLPHGNPDQARRIRKAAQGLTEQPCDGTAIDGGCYYWASASDIRPDQGGGVTMTIENPSVAADDTSGHSLEEMSVQAGTNYDNIVEIGSTVLTGDTYPQLFVFHWINGNQTCYDGCGFQPYSNTYYPGMDLASMVGQQVYNGYVFYKGDWWAWFNDQWLGYFPGSIWDGQFQASQQVQWFGEVEDNVSVPPFTQMGDGLFASSLAAAPMSTLCDVNAAAWVCFYYNQQTLYESDTKFYTIADTGFGAIRLGGPGT